MTLPHITAEDFLTWSAIIGVIAGFLAWVRKRTKPVWEQFKTVLQDWNGVPDRPGVPGRRGVMPQLADVRQQMDEIRMIATEARYHSMPNGGNSAYDKLSQKLDQNREDVQAVQSDVSALIGTMAEHTNQLNTFGERMDASEKDREGIHREISGFKFGGTERQQS